MQWARPARELDRLVRAFNPFPICFSHLQGQRVKIWQAQPAGTALLPEPPGTILRSSREGILVNCGEGQLMIQQLQLPGAKPLSAEQVLNGSAELFAPGQRFSLQASN